MKASNVALCPLSARSVSRALHSTDSLASMHTTLAQVLRSALLFPSPLEGAARAAEHPGLCVSAEPQSLDHISHLKAIFLLTWRSARRVRSVMQKGRREDFKEMDLVGQRLDRLR